MKKNYQTVSWLHEHWSLSSLVRAEEWSILHFKSSYTIEASVYEQKCFSVMHEYAPDPPHGIGNISNNRKIDI